MRFYILYDLEIRVTVNVWLTFVTVGGCNLSGRAINYVGVFCRERDFHTLARIVALITTIAQLRLKLKIQVTLLIMCALSFYSLYDAIDVARI